MGIIIINYSLLFILHVNSKSVKHAVRGELGQFPLGIDIICRVINHWLHVTKLPESSLAHLLYKESVNQANVVLNSWASFVKSILTHIGFVHVWENQGTISKKKNGC